ncbi:MAG: gluconate permease [Pirellulales bacterium]
MTPISVLLLALVLVIGGMLIFRLHPFIVLIFAAFAVALVTPTTTDIVAVGQDVAHAFGTTASKVGIVIAMASILGACLSAAGGATRLVITLQHAVGPQRTPLALLLGGFVLGIPMYADTVFYLLMPLAQALWQRTGRGYLLAVLAIVCGATMTHSLVPPTPGPLFVAEALAVDMATMIAVGLLVGSISAAVGFAYAHWADHRWPLSPRTNSSTDTRSTSETCNTTRAPAMMAPLWASILPLLLPVVLISLASASKSSPNLFSENFHTFIVVLGDKNIALSLAAIASMIVLAWTSRDSLVFRTTTSKAIVDAGGIVLVIAAGGALGGTLRNAGLIEVFNDMGMASGLVLIPTAWLVTMIIRIAQGSATVAMITCAGMMAPIVLGQAQTYHPVYIAIAIGCGSKMGMWMNDSGFWVIARMSSMSERETLRSASAMMAIESTVGLAITLLLAACFPMT